MADIYASVSINVIAAAPTGATVKPTVRRIVTEITPLPRQNWGQQDQAGSRRWKPPRQIESRTGRPDAGRHPNVGTALQAALRRSEDVCRGGAADRISSKQKSRIQAAAKLQIVAAAPQGAAFRAGRPRHARRERPGIPSTADAGARFNWPYQPTPPATSARGRQRIRESDRHRSRHAAPRCSPHAVPGRPTDRSLPCPARLSSLVFL